MMAESLKLMSEQMALWLLPFIYSLLIFAGFWLFALLLRGMLRRFARHRDPARQNILRLIQQLVYISTLLVGLVTALGTAGVNVTALVTSLGLAGFAIGFALKDALSNLISGVLLLLYRPFAVGDEIVVAGFDGKVISIDLRYTMLQLDNRVVFIPNSKLFTESVVLKDEQEEDAATDTKADSIPDELIE